METGVATRPLEDMDAYREKLNASVYKSALLMRPVFEAASSASRKIVFAEGEDERVLRAAQTILENTIEHPILIGRPDVIVNRCERLGLDIRPDRDFSVVNPENDPRYRDYWGSYHEIMKRRGVTPDLAKAIMRTNSTAIAAVMVHREEASSMICGTFGEYRWHLNYIQQVLGNDTLSPQGSLSLMIDPRRRASVHRRYPCARFPLPRATVRDCHWRGASRATLWSGAQDCLLLTIPVWQPG